MADTSVQPASGHKDSDEERQVLADVFNSATRAFEFLQFDNPADIASVSARAVKLAQETGGIVVAAGGDGTINAVAGAVLRSGCPFGVLPQGTFNYFGRTHAIFEVATDGLRCCVERWDYQKAMGRFSLAHTSILNPQR